MKTLDRKTYPLKIEDLFRDDPEALAELRSNTRKRKLSEEQFAREYAEQESATGLALEAESLRGDH